LFFGGVTRRFPTLNFAFLECGVAWASTLLADLVARWGKRNRKAIENYNPANLNLELLSQLCRQYGAKRIAAKLPELMSAGLADIQEDPATIDEFERCGIERPEAVYDLFVPRFYFGCEGDDPSVGCAFNQRMNPFGARLGAVLSSDISHWDVPDMTEVLSESYELIEKGIINADDFRDFAFTNPVRLWAGMNPDFFKGTVVETAVNNLLSSDAKHTQPQP
jgi:hypothetical protein